MWLVAWRGFNKNQIIWWGVVGWAAELSMNVAPVISLGVSKLLLGVSNISFQLPMAALLELPVMLNVFFMVSYVADIIFDVSLTIAFVCFLEIMFVLLVKLATMKRESTLRSPFWILRAALHFISFPAGVLGVASIKPSRSVCTVTTTWLYG